MLQLKITQLSRWKLICENLKALAKKTSASVDEVAVGVPKYSEQSFFWRILKWWIFILLFKTIFPHQEAIFKYNPKYKGQWSFDALSTFVEVSIQGLWQNHQFGGFLNTLMTRNVCVFFQADPQNRKLLWKTVSKDCCFSLGSSWASQKGISVCNTSYSVYAGRV